MADHDEHELRDALTEAAVAAEVATGAHESTPEEARSHLLVRAARVTAGLVVTLLGLVMLVLPGPGLLVVFAGLSILAIDVPFAARLVAQVRRRLPDRVARFGIKKQSGLETD